MLELIVLIILCQALRFVNVFPKMKIQSSINEFNDSTKIFGLKREANSKSKSSGIKNKKISYESKFHAST